MDNVAGKCLYGYVCKLTLASNFSRKHATIATSPNTVCISRCDYFIPSEWKPISIRFLTVDRRIVAFLATNGIIERFLADGGMALDLWTSNPVAGRLYERHGFWYSVGDGMRYIAPTAWKALEKSA